MTDDEMIQCAEDGKQIQRLRAIMHRLRAPGGCPWDAEQTHATLVPHLIEEAYETVDTIKRQDWNHLQEELGDLLLQVVFHAEIAEQDGRYNLDDIARGISDKLIRRHPHVYATSQADDPDAVLKQWDEIKRQEKGLTTQQGFLHETGKGLPAMLRAAKLQKKAGKVGFDWPDDAGVVDKIREELAETEEVLAEGGERLEEELGDLLFSVVNLARKRKLNPEILLEAANQKFEDRFTKMQLALENNGTSLDDADLDTMEAQWQAAK
ncbi:nucleoside triphosphate pyrophosphohydrolase [Persicirhabdus sediminis]|uniref:Nucleoside triphosphate pyrophosphohydrolase n=1 Tax=Persicirhabdus sediminis TaxID=454144 RepID=A0A8J7SKW1_9BACT|nr:nucleoside triphosphate pyrophosphohydrolase [Persicirhabdus sediminis]MBK1791981.1 nucleoside triphosphate pyrophosphohydrolase [Persicirhabdus sediminis]